MNILILNEKWTDAKPEIGFSNSFHNIITTAFQYFKDDTIHTIHMDEAFETYHRDINDILPNYCEKNEIKIIFMCLLYKYHNNPNIETYEKLKKMGIKICIFFPDTGLDVLGLQKMEEFNDLISLYVSWDNPYSEEFNKIKKLDNHIFLWVPQDKTLYFDDVKTIPASFIGSTMHIDRNIFLKELAVSGIPGLRILGGRRESNLSFNEYARFIRQSSIGINFSISLANYYQTKGRIFEILASNSLLLEYRNPSTASLFEPGKDYVEFTKPKELIGIIKYYTEHEDERKAIAQHGHETYLSKYTSWHYWQRIMDYINADLNKTP